MRSSTLHGVHHSPTLVGPHIIVNKMSYVCDRTLQGPESEPTCGLFVCIYVTLKTKPTRIRGRSKKWCVKCMHGSNKKERKKKTRGEMTLDYVLKMSHRLNSQHNGKRGGGLGIRLKNQHTCTFGNGRKSRKSPIFC